MEEMYYIPGISNNNSRILVIEYSVRIEEVLSETIGSILDINWESSKSLGFESGALSYNQKVSLLQDKRSISKEMKNKLTIFMQIRNKFAHVKAINSFDNYFKLSKNSQENKNQLDKWYLKPDSIYDDFEINYQWVFFHLYNDILMFLFKVKLEHLSQTVSKNREYDLNAKLIEILKNKTLVSPITIDNWNESIKDVVKLLKKDQKASDLEQE